MRLTTFAASIAAIVLLLAACGGGGGSNEPPQVEPDDPPQTDPEMGDPQPDPDPEPEPEPEPVVDLLPFPLAGWTGSYPNGGATWFPDGVAVQHYSITDLPAVGDAQHMPVYHDDWADSRVGAPVDWLPQAPGRRIGVGVGQGPGYIGGLPTAGRRGDIGLRHGRVSDGAGRAAVSNYLSEALGTSVTRWPAPPEVRLIGTSNATERQRLLAAVQLLNAALPPDARLTTGAFSNIPPEPRADGVIDVEFVDCYGPRHSCGGGTAAATEFNRSSDGRIEHSYIVFSRQTNSYRDDRQTVILLAHELMHALGLQMHASPSFATILEGTGAIHYVEQAGQPQPLSLLYPADREALRALYGELDIGDSPTDFGPWSSQSVHLAGNGEHANFGVALRNGYAEPWAHGYMPGTTLANNRALAGSATWTGALLGFSGRAPVAGDAEIGVTLATLTGRADFTSLETWAAGAAPGAEGSGTTWLDGDLGYTIAVRGNTFRETGGDDGRLTGIFTGRSHEGAAGTLERDDLTA